MADASQPKYSGYGRRSLWQWILIYLIIGVIVYGLVYYLFFARKGGYSNQSQQYGYPTNTQQQQISPSGPTSQKNVVTLSTSGFTPKTLTIKVGETVTWINMSGETATVNSNPHPVHTDYPPLNLGDFANGKKHTLTFNKAGTYGYHNHYYPNQTATIIVQ